MRPIVRHLSFVLLLVALSLHAGQRPVLGTETILGDAARAPLPNVYDWLNPFVATDGDGFLVAWTARNAIYVQRFNRLGQPLGQLPSLLLARPERGSALWLGGLVHAGGNHYLFFNDTGGSWVFILTRDGQIVERRPLFSESVFGVEAIGGEILAGNDKRIVRMREDLTVIGEIAGGGWRFIDTPKGVLALLPKSRALIVRALDGSAPREVPVEALVWSGTEFLGSTGRSVQRFDAQLQALGTAVALPVCCSVQDLVVLGNDRVFVTADDETTKGVIVERGVPVSGPLTLGERATTLRSADNQLFSIDRRLTARLFAETAGSATVTGEVQITPDEMIAAGFASATEVAIARVRIAPPNSEVREVLVSILDHEGRLLREVSLGNAWLPTVALAHDGRDFYALISEIHGGVWLRKVESGAAPIRLNVSAIPLLAWNGSAFVIAQDGFPDYKGSWQYLRRFLWLGRDGTLSVPPCENWSFFGGNDVRIFNPGPEMIMVAGTYINATVQPFRGGCPDGPPADRLSHLQLAAKTAWQDGKWAVVRAGYGVTSLDVALSDDVASGVGPWHRVAPTPYGADATIAPIEGSWLVLWRNDRTLSAAVVDDRGFLSGSRLISQAVSGVNDTLMLVPLTRDRVLAVYRRPVYEPPYSGSVRVMVLPLTVEEAQRRRPARP